MLNGKHWQVCCFGKRNVLGFDLEESIEELCSRGRGRLFYLEGKTETAFLDLKLMNASYSKLLVILHYVIISLVDLSMTICCF